MRKILAIIALSSYFSGFGQTNSWECTMKRPQENPSQEKALNCSKTSSEHNNYYNRYIYYSDIYNVRNEIVIPVDIHVWQKNDGSSNYANIPGNITDLTQALDWASHMYQNNNAPSDPIPGVVDKSTTKIRFVLKNIYFNQNTVCWGKGYGAAPADGEYLNGIASSLHPSSAKNFNIHITGVNPASFAGYAVFPTTDLSQQHYIVTFNKLNLTVIDTAKLWSFAQHLAHEFGHNFDLGHTYDGSETCNQSDPDYLDDVFGTGPSVVCPHSSGWSCDAYSPSNSCTNNLMGGVNSNLWYSPKQVYKMHRALALKSIRKYAYAYNFDANKIIDVASNQTWDFNIKMYNTLRVKAGYTLTIKCIVEFVPEASLIIEPGARVIIDGGKLTNEYYHNQFWQGVQVWGTSNQHQYPETQPTYQGKLQLINDGTIENAVNGAQNWKPDDYNKIGGVIISSGGHFINNKRAVQFIAYENFATTNPALKRNDLSKFTNTNFEINNNYVDDATYFLNHVTMWAVNGIYFTDCHFSNKTTNKYYRAGANRGIYSIDAGYFVNARCPYILQVGQVCPDNDLLKSSFEGFTTGIEAVTSSTARIVSVDQTIFKNNLRGVYISAVNNFAVNRSDFEVGSTEYSNYTTDHYGLYAINASGFKIEDNEFVNTPLAANTVGTYIEASGGESNRVYRNKYTNLKYGQTFMGINRNPADPYKGLQFICNRYDNNSASAVGIGIFLNSQHGVSAYQGTASLSSGNQFTNRPSTSNDIANLSVWPTTYYHTSGVFIPTNNTTNVGLISVSNAHACLSTFGAGQGFARPGDQQASLKSMTEEYDVLRYNYGALFDKGNTSAFVENIQTEWKADARLLRNKLIEQSPYVSQESILEAISQNVLPNAMILEICLANPESSKGEAFIQELNKLTNADFPEYMLNYIRQNWFSKTLRTDIEHKLSELSSEIFLASTALTSDVLMSEEISFEDKFNAFSREKNTQTQIDLIELCIENGKIDMADSLYTLFAVNDDDVSFKNIDKYIRFHRNLNGKKISELDSKEIEILKEFAQLDGKIREYSRNILCFFHSICYETEVYDMSVQTNNAPARISKEDLNEIFYDLSLSPNPSVSDTKLKWNIMEELSGCNFKVYELSGHKIMESAILTPSGEKTIDTKKLGSGIYIISLENKGEIKSSVKLVVEQY